MADIKVIERPKFDKRDKNSHKGCFGTALSVTGCYGMPGASVISGRAAVRSGVGILKLACIEENYTAAAVALPEAILVPCVRKGKTFSADNAEKLKLELKGCSALLLGCGMGVSEDARALTEELMLHSEVPVILDADGINNIAGNIEFIKQVKAPLVLTPHPGEMARLLGTDVKSVEVDRFGVAEAFAKEYGVYLCLKGANTVVATPNGELYVNQIGNPGMATAGSGDMLAGVMLALLASGRDIVSAVCDAVWLHSAAGDEACKDLSENAMLPTDMIERLYRFF